MSRGVSAALLIGLTALALAPACGESPSGSEPAAAEPAVASGPPHVLDLSGPGWGLWLDARASWKDDELFLPGVDLKTVPVREPSGGWAALQSDTELLAVTVPGTVEQFLWGALDEMRRPPGDAAPTEPRLDGDFTGVSWWTREFELPADWLAPTPGGPPAGEPGARAFGPPVAELRFDAVRLRAEVYVNQQLVGYDVVGNTPFEMDVTRALQPGRNRLAVRVTDPGGNFDWIDFDAQKWGRYTLPASHGFCGITGPVRLELRAPLRVSEIAVLNGPEPTHIELRTTVRNSAAGPIAGAIHTEILTATGEPAPGASLYDRWDVAQPLPPGDTTLTAAIDLPGAALWSPEHPELYRVRVSLHVGKDGPAVDVREQRFGFRSFSLEGVGDDASFKLNGQRIVLRSAISWGFWPTSGVVPTLELARAQVADAKTLGLNMLNHHRTIAASGLLDVQDELGLLAYCEPGGYASHGGDAFCKALAREKLLRMVRRDRSHPSVVIWNLINEETAEPTEEQRRDLLEAHALDPSRVMTFTSGWSKDGDDPLKLHARPFDAELYTEGWSDNHNAPGPGVWRDEFWKRPSDYLRRSENRGEIVFWGEEGAIAAPPRLAVIAPHVNPGEPGWDGADYLAWRDALAHWLDEKGWSAAGIDVDGFTTGLGSVAYDYQARAIENVRLGDVADGYVINGWEDSKLENHSGIVDVWRNLKGDPAPLQRANAKLALVVRLRTSVGTASEWLTPSTQSPTGAVADIGLIDETGLSGPHTLVLAMRGAEGQEVWRKVAPVTLEAGPFGRMLAEGLAATFEGDAGRYVLSAELRSGATEDGALVASGSDELLLVDWKSRALPARLALFEKGRALRRFFEENDKQPPEDFRADMGPLDVVAVGDWDPEPREPVPASALALTGYFYKGDSLPPADVPGGGTPTAKVEGGALDFEWSRAEPAPGVGTTSWIARWTGTLAAPESGRYVLHTLSDDGVRLWLDGQLLIDHWDEHGPEYDRAEPIELAVGESHALRVEYFQKDVAATLRLLWTTPARLKAVNDITDELVRRAQQDGTTVLVFFRADVWARLLAERGLVKTDGRLDHGRYWLGGGFVAQPHPILNGLPTGALGRPWQELVQYGALRFGVLLSGEEAVIGCVTGHQFRPGTALGVIPAGKGRIVLSTLDILRTLNGPPGPGDLVRKLFTNLLSWGAEPAAR